MPVPPKLTAQLVSIEQAANRVAAGHMSIEEFTTLVDEASARFEHQLSQVKALEIPADFRAEDPGGDGRWASAGWSCTSRPWPICAPMRRNGTWPASAAAWRKLEGPMTSSTRPCASNWAMHETYVQSLEEYAAHAGGNIAAPPPL